MVVCLCAGSSDRDIERAVEAGARNLSEIGDLCRAGLDCGGCRPTLLGILHRRSRRRHSGYPPSLESRSRFGEGSGASATCEDCPRRNRVELVPSLACGGGESSSDWNCR